MYCGVFIFVVFFEWDYWLKCFGKVYKINLLGGDFLDSKVDMECWRQ